MPTNRWMSHLSERDNASIVVVHGKSIYDVLLIKVSCTFCVDGQQSQIAIPWVPAVASHVAFDTA